MMSHTLVEHPIWMAVEVSAAHTASRRHSEHERTCLWSRNQSDNVSFPWSTIFMVSNTVPHLIMVDPVDRVPSGVPGVLVS